MKIKKNISILGCGWLGYQLGIDLIMKGFTVKASTRYGDPPNDLATYSINIGPSDITGNNLKSFFNSDIYF